MKKNPSYLNNKICLNVLTGSLENAREIYEATEGNVVLGLLSKNYESVEEAVLDMKRYQKEVNNAISVGLGAGDPKQWKMVAEISSLIHPQHINQVCTATGYTRGVINQEDSVINSLISPTGKVGYVNMATGEKSSLSEPIEVPVRVAVQMIKEMGANSVKFFPMRGLETVEEYRALCKCCAELNFMVEPTGGLDLNNFEEIVKIALDIGVPKVIPHVYSSIIDKESGNTKIEDIKEIYEIMKKLTQ